MSGVQVDKRTDLGGQRVVVRGYGNDQKFNNWGTKFYLNSVPITSADGVTVLEDIDFALINNIEVIKGPASTMYGGGVGGTVRFYMRPELEKGVGFTEKFAMGSFGLLQSNTRVDAVGDNFAIMLDYNHLQSNGYRPNGGSLKNNYAFKGDFKINTKQFLSVYASQNYSFEHISGQISYADYYAGIDNGNTAYIRKGAGNQYTSSRAIVTHNWKMLPNFSNTTSIFFSNLDLKSISAGALGNSDSPNYGFRTTFNLKNKISENWQSNIEFGMEYLTSKSLASSSRFTGSVSVPLELQSLVNFPNSSSNYKTWNKQSSVFAIERLSYKPWEITFLAGVSGNSLKYDRQDLFAGLINGHTDATFNKKFSTVFTPHLALQKVYKKQIFNLSYSEGYNAPTSSTAFISGNINAVNDNLLPERAKMWDFSIQGLLYKTKFDYQISVFKMNISDKLTQVKNGATMYWANTGDQSNQGLETSLGYVLTPNYSFIKNIRPYVNWSFYDFKYSNFNTIFNGVLTDYTHETVVGVPKNKYSLGLDFDTNFGLYFINTFNYLGNVYTNFANDNLVKGFSQYNAKLGYKKSFGNFGADIYIAGNNLTNQINYTFLFLGNNSNDSDVNSNYPGVKTDINPGPKKAYFFTGLNLKYHF